MNRIRSLLALTVHTRPVKGFSETRLCLRARADRARPRGHVADYHGRRRAGDAEHITGEAGVRSSLAALIAGHGSSGNR